LTRTCNPTGRLRRIASRRPANTQPREILMHRFRNILVAIDGDRPAQGVLARAARLAKQGGASVKLIAVVEEFPWYARLVLPTADELQALIVRKQTEVLEQLAEPLRRDGLAVVTVVLRGRRHIEMVRQVLRGDHDLLMKEAGPNEGVLFGSTDMHLLRACPCPVWLVRPGYGDRPFSRILAPVDPAPPPDETDLLHIKEDLAPKDATLDARILDLAGSLADGDGAELHVLHVWSAPGEGILRGDPMLAQGQVERYVEDSRAEARKALDHLLASSPERHTRRSVHLLKGDPADVIGEFAKTGHVDLIVMGTVARTGIGGLLIGNTAESVLQRVDCSVLAVKPDGFVSPVRLDEG
jgi:nucleotide-binding universal stress UspA family protein